MIMIGGGIIGITGEEIVHPYWLLDRVLVTPIGVCTRPFMILDNHMPLISTVV